ncbi:hypothetical protein [Treponema medium]|nr:hypothetical protein [Treponema medium]
MLIGKYDYDTDIAVQLGLSREKIAQATGLTTAEVEAICNG